MLSTSKVLKSQEKGTRRLQCTLLHSAWLLKVPTDSPKRLLARNGQDHAARSVLPSSLPGTQGGKFKPLGEHVLSVLPPLHCPEG